MVGLRLELKCFDQLYIKEATANGQYCINEKDMINGWQEMIAVCKPGK